MRTRQLKRDAGTAKLHMAPQAMVEAPVTPLNDAVVWEFTSYTAKNPGPSLLDPDLDVGGLNEKEMHSILVHPPADRPALSFLALAFGAAVAHRHDVAVCKLHLTGTF